MTRRTVEFNADGENYSVSAETKEAFVNAFVDTINNRLDHDAPVGDYEDFSISEMREEAETLWDDNAPAEESVQTPGVSVEAAGVKVVVSTLKKDATGS